MADGITYASAFKDDTFFGAIHNAFDLRWTGSWSIPNTSQWISPTPEGGHPRLGVLGCLGGAISGCTFPSGVGGLPMAGGKHPPTPSHGDYLET